MTIEEIADKRPHLKDALGLYEKVETFKISVIELNINITAEDITYPPGSVDAIFKSFSSVFDIPEDFLSPLKEAMALGQIDLARLPLNESVGFSLPYHEDELAGVLFLIGKPFFIQLKNSLNKSGSIFWKKGRCPVCSSVPSLSFIERDEGKTFYCSYCENRGHWHRIGCPRCENRNARKFDIITADKERGFRIELCNECKSYMKTADDELLSNYTPELLDIISLPLDVIAQEKGYRRHSPNPIGMVRMA